jgi:hypothetical protein
VRTEAVSYADSYGAAYANSDSDSNSHGYGNSDGYCYRDSHRHSHSYTYSYCDVYTQTNADCAAADDTEATSIACSQADAVIGSVCVLSVGFGVAPKTIFPSASQLTLD